MKKDIGNRLTIEDLARNQGISPSCYAAIFKAQMYESPINYFNELKVQKAAQYLVSTGRSIKSIGLELGFADQYYFSRLFSKIIGISPSQYKQSTITQVRGMNCSSASI